MAYDVEVTDEFKQWFESLDPEEQEAIDGAVEHLIERGPALGRPLADTLKGSRYPNMKELRPTRANIRIFFAFDPRRSAILLIGGSKTNLWRTFYDEMIPVADSLYEAHLEEIKAEGRI